MESTIAQAKLIEVFDHLAPIISDEVGGPVHLVKVIGPRWSYVAGHVPEELPFVEPQRVMLDGQWAVLYYPQAGRRISAERIRSLFLGAGEIVDEA